MSRAAVGRDACLAGVPAALMQLQGPGGGNDVGQLLPGRYLTRLIPWRTSQRDPGGGGFRNTVALLHRPDLRER